MNRAKGMQGLNVSLHTHPLGDNRRGGCGGWGRGAHQGVGNAAAAMETGLVMTQSPLVPLLEAGAPMAMASHAPHS